MSEEPTTEKAVVKVESSSPTIGKLALALAKAQAVIEPAKKNQENPFFRSKYADLSNVWDSIRKALTDNELAVIQTTRLRSTGLSLVTVLAHSSGEFVSGEYPINPTKHDPQGIGSAITYARRYALGAIVGVSTEDDDDGNAASQSNGAQAHHHAPQQPTQQQYQQPQQQAPQQQQGAPREGQYPPLDTAKYQWRLHLPFKVKGANGEEIGEQLRTLVKGHKFRFNKEPGEDGKQTGYWYGNGAIEPVLQRYHRPLEAAAPETTEEAYAGDDIPF